MPGAIVIDHIFIWDAGARDLIFDKLLKTTIQVFQNPLCFKLWKVLRGLILLEFHVFRQVVIGSILDYDDLLQGFVDIDFGPQL